VVVDPVADDEARRPWEKDNDDDVGDDDDDND
jgi:hypothetical protein